MKTNFSKVLCSASLLWTGQAVFAGPLQRADVPADSVWVVHADCDALRATSIGKHVLAELEKPEARSKLAAFQAMFNLDLRTQLHDLTLYSRGVGPQDGVLLVYADVDRDRLLTLAQGAKDYQSTTYKQHVIHNWVDEKKKTRDGVKPRTYAAVHGNVVVFGQREARVSEALDILDRSTPNLSSSKNFSQLGTGNAGAFLQAAARKVDLASADPHAAILRLSQQVRFQLGENQGRVSATLTLEAKDEEVAGHIVSIGQGLIALMRLQTEKPESVKLAEALSIKQDGAGVTIAASLPTDDVVGMMKAGAARKAAAKARAE